MRKDLIVIVFLGLLVLLGTAGLIILAAKGRATDPALVGIVTGALGALSSILVQTKDDSAKPEGATAGKVPPLAVLGLAVVLGLLALPGCSWLRSGNHAKDIASILTCISGEAAAGKSPGEIALTCGLQSADEVIDLVTRSQGVAAAAPKMGKPSAAPSSISSGSK